MTRQQVVLLLRKLLKRMEEEEFEINEFYGHDYVVVGSVYKYINTGHDTFVLKFLGPKQKTVIENVLVVWPDSTTEYRPWNNLRGLSKQGVRPAFLYCPVNPKDIYPETHRLNVMKQLTLNNVHYIKENQ